MKKIFLLIISIIFCISCSITPNKTETLQITNNDVIDLQVVDSLNQCIYDLYVISTVFHDHDYLIFYDSSYGVKTIMHDPNCSCNIKSMQEPIETKEERYEFSLW